ncbi:MAG TPA: formate dehydrogenase accessory sulfurtransferase FdhD [Polyangiaceae bacterium]|nr:formate dehydrogenase accessory sulfurtransferase FdhD [Polyangiaceae bacterium]
MTTDDENGPIRSVATLQVGLSGVRERREEVVVEAPFAIQLNGEILAVTMRTPGHDDELTAGFMLAEGHGSQASGAPVRVAKRGTLSSASCGVCGRDDVEDLIARLSPVVAETTFRAADISSAMQRLPDHQPSFARTGGLHAAALFTHRGELVVAREDIGRHNAVDKVLGRAVLDGILPLSKHLLAVSGRTSFEIVQKAVAAGVPALVAISAPSSLAIELAERFGVLLIGFARGGGFTAYAGRFRLEGAA